MEDRSQESAGDRFSRQTLGSLAAWLGIILIVFTAWMAYIVVASLTRPTDLMSKLPKSETTAQIAILVEVANADIRMSGIQTAFALLSGLVFVVAGLLLFAAGFVAPADMSATTSSVSVSLTKVAPGLMAIIVGGLIIHAGVSKQLSRSLVAEISQATGFRLEPSQEEIQPATVGEGPAEEEQKGH